MLNRKSLSRVKHPLTCCLRDFVFLLEEGAWERPGLPALLACFSWGPWSQGKDPDATSPSDPAQGECTAFLASWTLRSGCMGLWEWSHARRDLRERMDRHPRTTCCVQGVAVSNVFPPPGSGAPAALHQQGSSLVRQCRQGCAQVSVGHMKPDALSHRASDL